MNKEKDGHNSADEQEEKAEAKNSRRDFLRKGSLGLAGIAGAAEHTLTAGVA